MSDIENRTASYFDYVSLRMYLQKLRTIKIISKIPLFFKSLSIGLKINKLTNLPGYNYSENQLVKRYSEIEGQRSDLYYKINNLIKEIKKLKKEQLEIFELKYGYLISRLL